MKGSIAEKLDKLLRNLLGKKEFPQELRSDPCSYDCPTGWDLYHLISDIYYNKMSIPELVNREKQALLKCNSFHPGYALTMNRSAELYPEVTLSVTECRCRCSQYLKLGERYPDCGEWQRIPLS